MDTIFNHGVQIFGWVLGESLSGLCFRNPGGDDADTW